MGPELTLGSGGLLNRIFAKTGLASPSIPSMAARIVGLVGLTWLVLLVLSVLQGVAWGGRVRVPFLHDTAALVRFLVSLPLLLVAEVVIGRALGQVVKSCSASRIVGGDERGRLDSAISGVQRLLDSMVPECVLIAIVALTLPFVADVQAEFAAGVSNWQVDPATTLRTMAGTWYRAVSHPIYRFLLLRWLWRYAVWTWFLWRLSRLRLTLTATHPDAAGGLSFLGRGQVKFGILAFALSAQVAGYVGRTILHEGAALQSSKYLIAGQVVLLVLIILGPLFIFTPQLQACRREGLRSYGALAKEYTDLFEGKWVGRQEADGEALLGSADIQSLADLSNTYEIVRGMRPYPFTLQFVRSLVAAAAIPFLPLLLFLYPIDELLKQIIRLLL